MRRMREQEAERDGEVCRLHGISEQTFYRWKVKYGGMQASDAQKLKALEDGEGIGLLEKEVGMHPV